MLKCTAKVRSKEGMKGVQNQCRFAGEEAETRVNIPFFKVSKIFAY